MNAILLFPSNLAAELRQLKVEVESHRQDIMAATVAFEQTQSAKASQDGEISRRIHALRQRLANLLA